MKLKILGKDGKESGSVDLPIQFKEPLRTDLIKKAFLAIQNNSRQKYGTNVRAGKRHSAELSRRRRKYRGSYGHGISRIPRKIMSRRGTQMYWVGAIVPGTVGGRRAHPPKAEKEWAQKINIKEKRKAIRSAISATLLTELAKKRGQLIPDAYPFSITDDFEKINKAKDLATALEKLGFEEELERTKKPRLKAGKAKLRGRRKKAKKNLLIVASESKELVKAAGSLPGIEVVNIKRLNVNYLAPGGQPGRATLFTKKAIEELQKGLFTNNYQSESKTTKKENKK
jgi:large subunit ribosomal protein L4e